MSRQDGRRASARATPDDMPCDGPPEVGEGCSAKCQLYDLPQAGSRFGALETATRRLRKASAWLAQAARKAVADPRFVWRKVRGGVAASPEAAAAADQPRQRTASVKLGLQPGERVRVKSPQAIRATLGPTGRCAGLGYMPDVMDRFCGGTYVVRKRVNQFFDERNWRLLKLRNVVILDEVFCEPARDAQTDYAGCDRTCYLFWKEAWLERVDDAGAD